MSDDIRSLFDRSLPAISVPASVPEVALRRGKRLRATRMVVATTAAVVVAVVTALGAQTLVDRRDSVRPAPAQISPTNVRDVDGLALALINDLRPLACEGYDFYFKSEVGGAAFRPVQCGAESRSKVTNITASPSPPFVGSESIIEVRIVRGPELVFYSFATEEAKQEWVATHDPAWAGRIAGPLWVVDVMEHRSFAGIRETLGDRNPKVLERPKTTWRLEGHVMQFHPPRPIPRISLARASRTLRRNEQREILGARFVRYSSPSNPARSSVPAWLMVFRRCVPSYGGLHAAPGCKGDRLHVLVNADTRARITTLVD